MLSVDLLGRHGAAPTMAEMERCGAHVTWPGRLYCYYYYGRTRPPQTFDSSFLDFTSRKLGVSKQSRVGKVHGDATQRHRNQRIKTHRG